MCEKIKVLHYTLGFLPNRTGGLVGYATSLMEQQSEKGHEVYALYPGSISLINREPHIKKGVFKQKIQRYELVNSLPLALMGGIKNPSDFKVETDINIFLKLLKEINPDVIHVHTMMGIYKEFFQAAKILGKKIIFTSHDYFGLAPEPNFFHSGKSYDESNTVEDWRIASNNAFSTKKLLIFQLKIYPFIRKIKNKISFFTNRKEQNDNIRIFIDKDIDADYKMLKKYYLEMFKMIDFYHFNSNVAKKVFLINIGLKRRYKVISITNDHVQNRDISIEIDKQKIRVGYVGPNKLFKGYDDFITLAQKINNDCIEFHTFGYEPNEKIENVLQHGKFKASDAQKIYESLDVLIVPSRWKETFGLVALEAVSFGKIVFVSENVGAKDIVDKEYIFNNISDLINKLNNIESVITNYKKNDVKTMDYHVDEIIKLYSEV